MQKISTKLIVGIVCALLILTVVARGCSSYNAMVTMDEKVTAEWAEVQNQYQRRYDLVPNLVSTVKGYANHEADVFKQVAEARSRAGGVVNISGDVISNPDAFAKYQAAQDALSSGLQRLLAVSENYPALKANENFLALQNQLEGTENRIAVSRKRFNESAQSFNAYIRRFPASIINNMFAHFSPKQYFAAGNEAQAAPKVEF